MPLYFVPRRSPAGELLFNDGVTATTRTSTLAASLAVQVARNNQSNLDLAVQQASNSVSVTLDTVVMNSDMVSTSLSMAVRTAQNSLTAINLLIQDGTSRLAQIGAAVQIPRSVSAALNLYILATSSGIGTSELVTNVTVLDPHIAMSIVNTSILGQLFDRLDS